MAITGLKSSKVTFYKMVSLPGVGGSKDAAVKSTQVSYRAFTTGLNRIGATINSTIVVNKQIRDALVTNLKLKDKEFEEEKKRFQKEKEEKNKIAKKGFSGFASVGKVVEKVAIGFLQGLALLGGALMKFVITQSVLRWMGNPANIDKLVKIVQAIVNVVGFFARFLKDNIVKMLDGLANMLDGKKNIFEKLGGFVTFITGFGAVLGAALILKKPGLVLKGVGWVLKTLYTSLFKTKARLAKQVASSGARGAAGAAGEGFGAWSASQASKGARGGGRFGAIAKGVAATAAIAVPIIVGSQMAGGPSEFSGESGSMSSGGDGSAPPQPKDQDARAAKGGVFTRPTSAVIGEKGPEVRMPLDNAKRMANSGIKPLSSLGGMFKGGGDSKQAQKLSDLFIAPFRGIGAGILANVSQVVSGMGPAGQLLTPILGNIITPIANSFGVPPSLVKTLRSKSGLDKKGNSLGKSSGGKSANEKIFGKGKLVTTDDKKFKRVADTSILGLLSNIHAAVQVIGNKAGGSTTGTGTSSGGAGGDNTPPPSVDQKRPGATGNMKAGQSSDQGGKFSSKSSDRHGGEIKFKGADRKPYKVIINATNGDYEVWEDVVLGKQIDISGDKNAALKTLAFSKVKEYFRKNAPQKGLSLGYLNQDEVKDKKAAGGWISGPHSGYPVSLDGGMSTSFIGHGTEWVGFKKAAGGSAFVIPYDTPATQNNPGLTSSRYRQAKQGGFALPGFAKGGGIGRIVDPKKNRLVKSTAPGRANGGIVSAAEQAISAGKQGPASPPCASWVRMVLGMAGNPAAHKTTAKGDLDPEKKTWGENMAASFAGSDMGTVIRNASQLEPGDIVLQKNTFGNFPTGAITHVSIASKNKGKIYHQPTTGGAPKEGGLFNFAAGIRLGGSGSIGDVTSGDTSTGGGTQEEDPFKLLDTAIGKLQTSLGYAPAPSSVEDATKSKDSAKADATKAAKEKAAKEAGAAIDKTKQQTQAAVQTPPSNPPQPIFMPGKTTTVPIEWAWAPTTSLYQPSLALLR